MSNAHWKYEIKPLHGFQEFKIPMGAVILDIKMQNGVPCFWAIVWEKMEKRTLFIVQYYTGADHVELDNTDYLGTYMANELVYHVFMIKSPYFKRSA